MGYAGDVGAKFERWADFTVLLDLVLSSEFDFAQNRMCCVSAGGVLKPDPYPHFTWERR
jgi:hypothetical protein